MTRKLVALIGVICAAILYVGILILIKPKPSIEVAPKIENSNLTHFSNEVLGLEFDYPKTWGEIRYQPADIITNLATVNIDYVNSDNENDNRYMVTLNFSQNHDTYIRLINDLYPGASYPNGSATDFGPYDNFKELIQSGDICRYTFSFNHGIYYGQEIFSECKNGIKESILKSGQTGSAFENYEVRRRGYKHLRNGYFDNLMLVNNTAFAQSQDLNHQMTLSEIKTKSKVDESKYLNDYRDLVTLVNSINTFIPPKPTPIVFQSIPNEEFNLTTIRQYYYWLSVKNFDSAYDITTATGVDFAKFKGWYQNIVFAKPRDFKKLSETKYEFIVDYQDENTLPTKYLVVMEVKNGKINTLSSEKLTSNYVTFANMTAVVKERNGQNYIVLTKNGVETVIAKYRSFSDDKGDINIDFKIFGSPKFSNTGRYLVWDEGGWEWHGSKLYDIQNMKLIDINLSSASTIVFNPNDTNLLTCAQNEMSGDSYALVYEMSTQKTIKDFIKDSTVDQSKGLNINCNFDILSQTATVKLSSWDETIPGETQAWVMK